MRQYKGPFVSKYDKIKIGKLEFKIMKFEKIKFERINLGFIVYKRTGV